MPQLRFNRDKRGYETTALTDTGGRRSGRSTGQRLLYWFRTPPGVRVGRAPIDEEAIRLLEQHNPDVEFDWTRILRDPPPEPAVRRDRDGRDRDRRDRRDARPPQRPRQSETPDAAAPARVAAPIDPQDAAEAAARGAAAQPDVVTSGGDADAADVRHPAGADADRDAVPDSVWTGESVAVEHHEPLAADHGEYTEYAIASAEIAEIAAVDDPAAADRVEPADVPDVVEPQELAEPPSAAAARLGSEGLVRLRARYAEVMARITEHPMDEPARAELKTKAERLNPDGWVTADEVTAALEQYETIFESLRAVVGRYPSDRRRRR